MKSPTLAALILSIFVTIVHRGDAVNYCSSIYSCGDVPNIGCNNTGAYASICPAGTEIVELSCALKSAIVNSHNSKRNLIAGGNLPGFAPAVRMATMQWDDELARLAELNAKWCSVRHDPCHNTASFQWSGQNIAKTWWSGGSPNVDSIVLPHIDAWWSEFKDTKMTDINAYPPNPSAVIGHFTVMTAEKNMAVGCGAIRYRDPALNNWDSITFVCNYARNNIINLPMYTPGPAASQCTTGINPAYNSLCHERENWLYDANVA